MKLWKLAEIINNNFGLPFLPEGHVRAHLTPNGNLFLKIGTHGIVLRADGEVLDSGAIDCPGPTKAALARLTVLGQPETA